MPLGADRRESAKAMLVCALVKHRVHLGLGTVQRAGLVQSVFRSVFRLGYVSVRLGFVGACRGAIEPARVQRCVTRRPTNASRGMRGIWALGNWECAGRALRQYDLGNWSYWRFTNQVCIRPPRWGAAFVAAMAQWGGMAGKVGGGALGRKGKGDNALGGTSAGGRRSNCEE